jgi:hypothetical protein
MSAVEEARTISDSDHILMGIERTPQKNINGVNYVHVDYVVI